MWQTGAHKMPIYSFYWIAACYWIAAWKVFFLWEILFRLPQISPLYDDTGYDVRAKFSPSGEVRNGSRRHCRMRGFEGWPDRRNRQYFRVSTRILSVRQLCRTARPIDGDRALRWQANRRSQTYHDNCKATVDFAEQAMRLAGVETFHAIQGWFEESLAVFKPSEPIAVLRLGADWYGSTLTCLRRVYPRVADGGLIILDHYYTWDGCARSLREFLVEASLTEHIRQYDNDVCFVVKRLAAARPPVKTNQDAADSRQVVRAS